VRELLPDFARDAAGALVRGTRTLARRAGVGPWAANAARLAQFADRHRGQRCFILGNGPSLARTDLEPLKREITFALNRGYLLREERGFASTYLVSINDLVLSQCAADIAALDLPRFLGWRARRCFAPDERIHFLDTRQTGANGFSRDIARQVFEGYTVTYVALQVAYYMGFDEVILIGVDHRFSTQGRPNRTVVSRGADPDHFSPAYFGQGFAWQLPDLARSERAYRRANEAFVAAGRTVRDATIGGHLAVFPKAEYASLFSR
jgi:hypothetical protein